MGNAERWLSEQNADRELEALKRMELRSRSGQSHSARNCIDRGQTGA